MLDTLIGHGSHTPWSDINIPTAACIELGSQHKGRLGKDTLTGSIRIWARFETDKLRGLWAYLSRLAARLEYSRSFTVSRLNNKYLEVFGNMGSNVPRLDHALEDAPPPHAALPDYPGSPSGLFIRR